MDNELLKNIPDSVKSELGILSDQESNKDEVKVSSEVRTEDPNVNYDKVENEIKHEETYKSDSDINFEEEENDRIIQKKLSETKIKNPVTNETTTLTSNVKNEPKETGKVNYFRQKTEEEEKKEIQSGTFADFQMRKNDQTELMDKVNEVGAQGVHNVLNSISVDLNNINIVGEKRNIDINEEFKAFKKPAFQVTAVQSHYSAYMTAMSMRDVNTISNSNLGIYETRRLLYQTIYSLIEDTSIGRMTFDGWLKVTSYHDLETLLYGVYSQTFPETNNLTITCSNEECNHQNQVRVNNNSLISVDNPNIVMAKIKEIISSSKDLQDLIRTSMVNTTERVILDESKIIFDIQVPSLKDHLELLKSYSNEELREQNESSLFGTLLFTTKAYIPDIVKIIDTGAAHYNSVSELIGIQGIIENLSIKDSLQLIEAVNNRASQYSIEYKLTKMECGRCRQEMEDINVPIESLLFFQMGQIQQ